MEGHIVERKAGWDTHGLPVEIEVQKQLDLMSNEAIEEYGMEAFNQKCKESVWTCLLYTSPSPRDQRGSRMPSSA